MTPLPPAILFQDSIFCPSDRAASNVTSSDARCTPNLSTSKSKLPDFSPSPNLVHPLWAPDSRKEKGGKQAPKHGGWRASPKTTARDVHLPPVSLPPLNSNCGVIVSNVDEHVPSRPLPPEPPLQTAKQKEWQPYLDVPTHSVPLAAQTARSFLEDQRRKPKSPLKSARGGTTSTRDDGQNPAHAPGQATLRMLNPQSRSGIVVPEALPMLQPQNLETPQHVAVVRCDNRLEELEKVRRFEMACFRRLHWEKAAEKGRCRRKRHEDPTPNPKPEEAEPMSPADVSDKQGEKIGENKEAADTASSARMDLQAAEAAFKAKLSISRLDRLGGGLNLGPGSNLNLRSLAAVPETAVASSNKDSLPRKIGGKETGFDRKGTKRKEDPRRSCSKEDVQEVVDKLSRRRGSKDMLDRASGKDSARRQSIQDMLLNCEPRKNRSERTGNKNSDSRYPASARRTSVLRQGTGKVGGGGSRALGRLRHSLLANIPHKLNVEKRLHNLQRLRRRSQISNSTPEPMPCVLNEEDRLRIHEVFRLYDADGSETLDIAELRDALSDLGFAPSSRDEKSEFALILEEVDREGDGELDLEEFEDLVVQVMKMLRQEQRRELYELFRIRDENEDGSLCMEETNMILKDLSLQPQTDEEKHLVHQIMDEVDENQSGDLDFLEFELFVVQVRERLGCLRRQRVRCITEDMGLAPHLAKAFKSELLKFRDSFDKEDEQKGNGYLSHKQVQMLLTECGLGPKTKKERDEMQSVIETIDRAKTEQVAFSHFLEIVMELRQIYSERRCSELQTLFKEFDKDGSESLSFGECSRMLEQMQVVPRTRMEQREIGFLFEAVDEDGSGELDFDEFAVLFQRIQEKLNSMQYKEELETSKAINISHAQLDEYRRAFEILDKKGSGELGLDNVRRMMDLLRIPISGDSLSELFAEVDEDESGLVEFKEFLQLMSMVENHVQKFGKAVNRASLAFSRPKTNFDGSDFPSNL